MSSIKRIESGKIYHYTSKDSVFGIIENRSLHLRNIEHMNDTNELKYLNNYLQSYKKRNFISTKIVSNILQEVERIIAYYDVFVFSTSSNKDSKTLWERYTKPKYDGYNIGFSIHKVRELFKRYEITEGNGNNILFFEDGEILYSELEKQKIVDENIKAYIFHHTTNQEDHNYNTNLMRTYLYLYSIFFKGFKKWSEEKEYRFAFFVEKEYAKRIKQTKKIDNKIITYISICLQDKDIKHPFEEIVIGSRNDYENDIIALRKLLDTKPYYKELRNNISKSIIQKK